MVAFLKSDVFVKFIGGFVLGTIGFLTLNPAEAQPRQDEQATVSAHSDHDSAL
ncbi:MAG: hypothetical protein QHC67_00335 [Sphingobium sp.]|uniref:hypothetical protein n=1 Tax=Sphingobium sp. TaxID=1912891 RepID=UPI0029A01B0B|nr:hypothetical protein [Sphingobium sp.]MDX3908255.1 hypothetical protein [Sphingobium sp.]